MGDPDERALVVRALQSGLAGCVEWHDKVIDRVRREIASHKLTPERIKLAVIAFVQGGGEIRQIREKRDEWKDRRDYYYKVVLPMPELFKNGLFVEMELADNDPDYPEVRLVNAHEQH
ncbi:MAG: hypothetical protein HYR84_06310 [Planctomycetes bacterium]|nr:hypothetical protein [Planctomycetota bacterium]